MSKKLKVLMITSLLLNILLVSFIGGKTYQHKTMMRGPAPLISLLKSASIPEERRSNLIADLKKLSPARKDKIQGHRTWADKTESILTASIFDETAYRAQLEERFLRHKPKKAAMIDTMVQIAATLNQADRTKMAHILKRQSKNSVRRRREK